MLREFCIILLLAGLGIAYSLVGRLSPLPSVSQELEAGEIRMADAKVLSAIWVDAGGMKKIEESHIPEALLLNEDDWDAGLFGLMNTWLIEPRPIVIYCESEACGKSKRIAKRLRESLPDAEIYSLKGGSAAWQE
jgi:3-mercaptopyruvate sulfurtransferase SseA